MSRILLALAFALGLSAATAHAQPAKGNTMVVMETSLGTIKVELFADVAPVTVKNFLAYVDDKHYDGTIYHRVIKDFMVQGGGFDANMQQKKTKPAIVNESANGLKNTRGTLAMARTNDPDSATSQFFINTVDNAFLNKSATNPGYCVFAKVVEGMDVVDKIRAVATGTDAKSGMKDVPTTTVTIKSIKKTDK